MTGDDARFRQRIPTQPVFRLLVGWLAIVLCAPAAEIPTATGAGTNNLPLITIREFLEGAPRWGERIKVRVRGTVTHSISDRTFFIQQDDAGTYVFHKPPKPFAVGEEVEVIGHPSLGTFSPTLQKCEARAIGPGKPPDPRSLTFNEARKGIGHMQVIRVRGRLAPERLRGGHTLILNAGSGSDAFTGELEAFEDLRPFAGLQPGSLLELTGVCSVRRDPSKQPAAFIIFLRSPADVVVLQRPSWWTPERTWRVLGITAFGLAAAFVWGWLLRRQVRLKTAQIRALNDELEQRVLQRTVELSAANKELEAFSYSVSHDLRAPARHIAGFAGLLQQNPALANEPSVLKSLQQITAAASHMGKLIDDLLAFARMARAPLTVGEVPLEPLVSEVIRRLQPDLASRDIEWRIAPLPSVRGDSSMLALVWQNLLSNAVKYTRHRPRSTIEINAVAGEKEWTFSVRDNGAGFDMQHAGQLFGVFHRLHSAEEFEGTGIGLANVRRIIERHGGRIWADAAVDKGATFFFTLPR